MSEHDDLITRIQMTLDRDGRIDFDDTPELARTIAIDIERDRAAAVSGGNLRLRDTWYHTEGAAVEDSLCIWCLRQASLCVIVDPCGDREAYEELGDHL